ncbi:MAG: hypothetical protein K1X79_13410 [Oligoflexia bacterium]|nr:hypothetical protein [Oligoflexia bacterium]
MQGATSQLSLLVEVGELSANVDLGKAPTEEAEIVVDVVLDTNAQKVQKATVDVRPKKRPTPRPTATPAPTTEFPLPLPTTAATPNPEPSATPSSPNETPGPIATPEAGMPVTGTVMLRSGAPAAGAMLRFVVAGRKISATVSEDGTFSTEAFPAFGKLKKTVVVKYHGLASVVNLAKTSLGKVPAGAFLTRLDLELSFAHQASGAKILKVNIAMLEYTFASALKAPVQLKPLVLQ